MIDQENHAPDALARQRQLVANLGRAVCFPHAVHRIRVIETHISFVILTGQFAYKIKKAVKLGFLDFSTLDKRLFFCREELRLNRRLAATMYLDVVAIGGTIDSPQVSPPTGEDSPVLEYAVRMIEFDQDCLLDRVLARGELTRADLDTLAVTIAEFHRRAPMIDDESDSAHATTAGSAQAIAVPMLDNFSDLRRLLDPAEDRSQLGAIEAWSRRRFDDLQATFAERRHGGRIRECHGDLHLGNMVRFADGVHVFDCIEFNPDLRWIDVISEIAFLVMDLAERGRPDYAFRFLNAYLEHSGDYEGLSVLTFYLVYRAMVRAKVARIRAAQPVASAASAAERDAALAASRGYVDYARRLIAAPPPGLIITHGFSGSGKTFISQQLLETIGAIRLRSDVERKRLHGLSPLAATGSRIGNGLYGESATVATYTRLADLARSVIAAGFTAIVDAAFLKRWQRDQFHRLAEALGRPLLIIDCDAPPAVLGERLAKRQRLGRDASEASIDVLTHQFWAAEPLSSDEIASTLSTSTLGDDEDELVTRARRFVAERLTT